MSISVFVRKTFILAGFLCLVILSEVSCSDPDLEVKSNLNSANSGNSSTEHDGGSNAGVLQQKDDHLDKSGDDVQKTSQKSNSSIPLELKEGTGDEKTDAALDQNLKPKEDKEKNVSGDDLVSKSLSKGENVGDSNGSSMPVEKGKSRGEECDTSYMCTDKMTNLVACLQVPGDESPNLSLLIRNGGKQPLKVEISAAQFVQLEKTQFQLQPEEDTMVKVSIQGAAENKSLIYLKAGQGRCTINFKDLISQELKGDNQYTYKTYYLNRLSRTQFYLVTLFAMVLILASGWMCVGFGKKYYFRKVDYQPVNMELPISDVSKMSALKTDATQGGGDDDIWVDDWDGGWGDEDVDEEASLTPTALPVTPSSLSSRGLASRRLSKEGWKD